MNSTITKAVYLTEPTLINPSLVESKLVSRDYLIVSGTTSFDGSGLHPYETIIIKSATEVTDQIKSFFPNLKSVIRIGTGLDNIDLAFCRSEGIVVYSAAGANADAVSEYVVGIMLYVTRRFNMLTEQDLVDWNRSKFVGMSMSEQTIGLIGFGHIGKLLHGKLSGFNCKAFLAYDPYLKSADVPDGITVVSSIEEVMERSSIVSLHVPLTEETKGMIDRVRLELLPSEAILINASRGGIVDETAVLELLANSAQFTYVADTIVNEPHGNKELFAHERIIVTPHIAGLTNQAGDRAIELALDNFLSHRSISI